MARKVIMKSGEDDCQEGLRSEDGNQPKVEGVKFVEYRRSDPNVILHMDLPAYHFDSAKKSNPDHTRGRVLHNAKTGQVPTVEAEKKEKAHTQRTGKKRKEKK